MVASVWYGGPVDGIIAADEKVSLKNMFHQQLLKLKMNLKTKMEDDRNLCWLFRFCW